MYCSLFSLHRFGPIISGTALLALGVTACQEPTAPESAIDPVPRLALGDSLGNNAVDDLEVLAMDEESATLEWTQVADSEGDPAWYRLKYDVSPMEDWTTATVGCDRTMIGTTVGEPMRCTVEGLDTLAYDFALMSFRSEDGVWVEAVYSNVATAEAAAPGAVGDLRVSFENRHSLTFTWTEVADDLGHPATYRLKVGEPPFDWSTARGVGSNDLAGLVWCDKVPGVQVGATISCSFPGPQAVSPVELEPSTDYEAQLKSFRLVDGDWVATRSSNVVAARTADIDAATPLDNVTVSTNEEDLTVRWTEVNDGTGSPASYQVRYSVPPFVWDEARVGCELVAGTAVGAEASCVIEDAFPGHHYRVQVASFRDGGDGSGLEPTYSNLALGFTAGAPAVTDLRVLDASSTGLTVAWTEVEDETGYPYYYSGPPSNYRLKYRTPEMTDWGSAMVGCDRTIYGTRVGATATCEVENLEPGTPYELQLMSFEVVDGVWRNALYSNIAAASTSGG